MSYYEDETTADALEAWCDERRDADMEMAQWAREARQADALRAAGNCLHSSSVGLPDDGTIYYESQRGLVGEQVRCTESCGQIFANSQAMYEDGERVRMGL